MNNRRLTRHQTKIQKGMSKKKISSHPFKSSVKILKDKFFYSNFKYIPDEKLGATSRVFQKSGTLNDLCTSGHKYIKKKEKQIGKIV